MANKKHHCFALLGRKIAKNYHKIRSHNFKYIQNSLTDCNKKGNRLDSSFLFFLVLSFHSRIWFNARLDIVVCLFFCFWFCCHGNFKFQIYASRANYEFWMKMEMERKKGEGCGSVEARLDKFIIIIMEMLSQPGWSIRDNGLPGPEIKRYNEITHMWHEANDA